MLKQRTRKFVTKILIRKTCSSLVKIISDGENNFTQNKYNKLRKISYFFAENKCNNGIIYSSITWCRLDRNSNSKLIIKMYFYVI